MVEYANIRADELDSCKIWNTIIFNNSSDHIIWQLISLTQYIAAVAKTWSLLG
jgi:hypothetical protein